MNLEKKKSLAVRALGIGRDRIIFNPARLEEIKEAITKQDIRDLAVSGAIGIKDIKGRKRVEKRKNRRRAGSKRHHFRKSKQDYVRLTRRLRNYLFVLRDKGHVSLEVYEKLRKEIRASTFKDLPHFRLRVKELKQ